MIIKSSFKISFTVLIVFLFSISSAGSAEPGKTITVAGITNKFPAEYSVGKSGTEGIYVELWKIWSTKTGIDVNYIITTP